ncbi:hypothetical protein BDV93DRAFT_554043 [Ceratobasidium sp. AG-I]|nr:hypothetical protein BDV93DRAFT_554043 [Ceratobasidium sp. AG-I]
MLVAFPTFALSALLHLLTPNATASVTEASRVLAVTLHNVDLTEFYDDHPTIQGLSGYALAEVERSLHISSPTDVLFYIAPVGAFAWDSSPALRSYTRNVVSYARSASASARDAASNVLHAPLDLFTPGPTPLDTLYASIADALQDPLFNLTSTATEPARAVFGPVWEWTPRSLAVFVPQPACPAQILTPDMSTASSLGKCGLGLERATFLDSLVPIYTPPSTHAIGSPTSSHQPIRSANYLVMRWHIVWLARWALLALTLVGQSCGRYVVLHKKTDCSFGELDAHSSKASGLINLDSNINQPTPNDLPLSHLHSSSSLLPSDRPINSSLPSTFKCLTGEQLLSEPAGEGGPVVDKEVSETLHIPPEPKVAQVKGTSNVVVEVTQETRSERTVNRAIEITPSLKHNARHDIPKKPPPKKEKRTVGRVEEDIFESTNELVAWLQLKKREDRQVARAQRIAPYLSSPRDATPSATNITPRNTGNKEDGEMELRRERNGGQVRGGKVRVRPGRAEGRHIEGGGRDERKWAGAEVGFLHIGYAEGVLVLEGVPLKEGRRKRK